MQEIARRWYPQLIRREKESRKTESSHRALDDIQASINELKFYRDNIFVPIEDESQKPAALRDETLKTAL